MYAALERGEVPGLTRIGGRILVNTRAFLTYFEEDQ